MYNNHLLLIESSNDMAQIYSPSPTSTYKLPTKKAWMDRENEASLLLKVLGINWGEEAQNILNQIIPDGLKSHLAFGNDRL